MILNRLLGNIKSWNLTQKKFAQQVLADHIANVNQLWHTLHSSVQRVTRRIDLGKWLCTRSRPRHISYSTEIDGTDPMDEQLVHCWLLNADPHSVWKIWKTTIFDIFSPRVCDIQRCFFWIWKNAKTSLCATFQLFYKWWPHDRNLFL